MKVTFNVPNSNYSKKLSPVGFKSYLYVSPPECELKPAKKPQFNLFNIFNSKSFERYLLRSGKVPLNDLKNLPPLEREYFFNSAENTVNAFFSGKFCAEPSICAKSGLALKQKFDEKFGSNYRIISLGTSPVPVVSAMEYLGAEVIYLPISGLHTLARNSTTDTEYYFSNYPNFGILMDYLYKNGVANKNDDKTNVLVDYCAKGRTISLIQNCIKDDFNISPSRLIKCDLAQEIEQLKTGFLSPSDLKKLSEMMAVQQSEYISNVPHFYADDFTNMHQLHCVRARGRKESEIFKKFDNFSRPLARAYSVCLINELNKLTGGELLN